MARANMLLERYQRPIRHLGACAAGGLLLAAPFALEQSFEHAEITDTIAGTPATVSYTHNSGSQLDLGIGGRVYAPTAQEHGIGLSIEAKDVPMSGEGSFYSLLSSGTLARYAGLYKDPQQALEGAASQLGHQRSEEFKKSERLYGPLFAGGLVVGDILYWVYRRERPGMSTKTARLIGAGSLAAAAVGSLTMPVHEFNQWTTNNPAVTDVRLPLSKLQGTPLEDVTVSNKLLQYGIDDGVDKVRVLLRRQSERREAFIATASSDLERQAPKIHMPTEDETPVLVGSDMHDNEAMTKIATQTVDMINELYGSDVLKLMVSTGDQGYGSSPEKQYIDAQAEIAEQVIVSPGNHDTDIAEQEMDDAGDIRIKDEPVTVDDLTIAGGEDPLVTPFGSPTEVRHPSEDDVNVEAAFGEKLYEQASEQEVHIVAPHEGYAAGSFMGMEQVSQTSLTEWFNQRGSNTIPWEDGVRDLPTSLLVYGHWHRMIAPRVVWNDDGSWTLVMELNTMGGAIGDPTISHFSTPNDAPGQTASFPIIYFSKQTGLVTGYQMYTFEKGGKAIIGNYIAVGTQDVVNGMQEEAIKNKHDPGRQSNADGTIKR